MDEYPVLRDIFAQAFETKDEAFLWDYLVAHDPNLRTAGVRVAVVDWRPVACTVVLSRRVRSRQGWVPGAVVTLVACHPDYQNQGYGGCTMRDALAYMAGQGLALGVLYGHPGYYPRFGFVPVLSDYSTILASAFSPGSTPTSPTEELRPAIEDDLPALAVLYANAMDIYPCSMARGIESWLWQVRNKETHVLLSLPDRQGYAFTGIDREHQMLVVREGAAVDAAAGRRVLAGLVREARTRGLAQVRLTMPPDHLLVRLALLHGAGQHYRPATAGMAAITCWDPLLPTGYRVGDRGLFHGGRLVLQAGRRALTELVVGYRDIDDLLLTPDVTLPDGNTDYELLQRDFPPIFPKYSLAPFWF